MSEDSRCCGSGTCIIDTNGHCWCGQRWDGDQLIGPGTACSAPSNVKPSETPPEAIGGLAPRSHP
jgi:hypothetical protein